MPFIGAIVSTVLLGFAAIAAPDSSNQRDRKRTVWPYPFRARSNPALNQRNRKNRVGGVDRSIKAHSAGLSVSALIAEMTIDTDMVTANCL